MTPTEKLIFTEIYSLDRDFGCTAKNEHFMDFFNLSARQVREYIKRLKDNGLISVALNKAKNSRTIRVVGKFARVSEKDIAKLGFLRGQLVDKYRI